jgi:nucleoside 2-deoxyribosyltransferase
MRLVYIAGPLFAPNDWAIRQNIHRAAEVGFAVAEAGAYPLIPHTNTGAVFIGTITPEWWYAGTLEALRRCDAVMMVQGWPDSKGAVAEREEAKRLGKPVFNAGDYDELWRWLRGTAP